MVEFGNKPIPVAPAPERKKKPEPSEDTTFGGEPILPETVDINKEWGLCMDCGRTPASHRIEDVQRCCSCHIENGGTPSYRHEGCMKLVDKLSETPVVDEVGEPEPQTLKETVAKVSEPKLDIPKNLPLSKCRAKPLKKKGKGKHNKKKRRRGR